MTEAQNKLLQFISQKNISEIKKLLSTNPELVNTSFSNGSTPLLEAIMKNHLDIASFLIKSGANPNIQDKCGKTPLLASIMNHRLKIASFLIERGANPDIQDKYGNTPLLAAISNNQTEIAIDLLDKGANPNIPDNGYTPLLAAIMNNQTYIASLLLYKGANPNIQDKYGNTPLLAAIRHESPEMIIDLLKNGANPNIQDNYGDTPLLAAIRHESTEIVAALLDKGANPNIQDNNGDTPLLAAIRRESPEIITALLLNKGANPNIQDNCGNTALNYAATYNKIAVVYQLLNAGATFEDSITFNNLIDMYWLNLDAVTQGINSDLIEFDINAVFSKCDIKYVDKILNVFDNNPYDSSDKKHDLLKVFFNNFNLDFPSYDEFQNLLKAAEESASNLPVIKEKINNLNIHPYIAKAFLYEFNNEFYNTCNITREQFINTFVTNALSKIITFDPNKHSGPTTHNVLANPDLMTEIFSYFKFPNLNSIETDLFGDYPADNTDLL